MKKTTILLLGLITISINCNSQSSLNSIQDKLVGKWFSDDNLVSIQFSRNKVYKLLVNDRELFTSNYTIETSNDSIFMYHISENDTLKCLVFLNENELLQISYKHDSKYIQGINEHIDEVGFFYKKKNIDISKQNKEETRIQKNYFLPDNFIGEIMIAYKPFKHISSEFYNTKEKSIDIPKSGLLEIEGKEDIRAFARRDFRFYYKNADNNEPIEIKKIDLFKKYSVQELNIYKEDDICVTPLGYNQLNRPDVNTIFGKKIVGNIEFYKIDTFKNIRKYLKD